MRILNFQNKLIQQKRSLLFSSTISTHVVHSINSNHLNPSSRSYGTLKNSNRCVNDLTIYKVMIEVGLETFCRPGYQINRVWPSELRQNLGIFITSYSINCGLPIWLPWRFVKRLQYHVAESLVRVVSLECSFF